MAPLCKPGSVCACAVPCIRCKCKYEADKYGNRIYREDTEKGRGK